MVNAQSLFVITVQNSEECLMFSRDRQRLFDQVGHQTTNAYVGNKFLFTKYCHRQTYQSYEQSKQKLGTFLGNKVL